MAALKASGRPWTAQQGRRRVLRAEARIRAARRHRPRLAVRHRAGRPQPAGPARRLLHRRALQQGDAGDAAPRDVRLARALHRHPDRALCRATSRCGSRRPRRWSRPSSRTPTTTRARCAAAARRAGLRVEPDLRNEKINYKVREHSLAKVPVLLVVGKKEAAERTVSIRRLGSQDQKVMGLEPRSRRSPTRRWRRTCGGSGDFPPPSPGCSAFCGRHRRRGRALRSIVRYAGKAVLGGPR